MARLRLTFDDAHILAFPADADAKPVLQGSVGSSVLHLPGDGDDDVDWALSPNARTDQLERLHSDIAGIFPKAELVRLEKGLARGPGEHFDFEYLGVAVRAIIAGAGQGSAPTAVDVALPTIAALLNPYAAWNSIDGGSLQPKALPPLGLQGQLPSDAQGEPSLWVFDGSSEKARESLEIACVGAGAPVVRSAWVHNLVKEHLRRVLTGKVDEGDIARELKGALTQQMHAIIIVEVLLGGLVLTPLWKFDNLSLNRHSVFIRFDFVAWLDSVLMDLKEISRYDKLTSKERSAYRQSVLFDLPLRLSRDGEEHSLRTAGTRFAPRPGEEKQNDNPLVKEIASKWEPLADGLYKSLLAKVYGSDDVKREAGKPDRATDQNFNRLLDLFHAFATEDGSPPDNRNSIDIRGYLPTGLLISHGSFGPIVAAALRNLLWDPSLNDPPKLFEICMPLDQVTRFFETLPGDTNPLGGRFWEAVSLNGKAIKPRLPRRELVTVTFPRQATGSSRPGEFSLRVTPNSETEIEVKIDFDLPDYCVGGAVEVEVRMESLERIVVRLFLNGEPYYGGKISNTGSLKSLDRGQGEFDIFASEEHFLVSQIGARIRGAEKEHTWRLVDGSAAT